MMETLMNGVATWPQLFFIGGVILASITTGCGALLWIWNKLNAMADNISREFKETRHTLHGKIEQVKALVDDDIDDIRKKITEVELFTRDTFVRNDHFAQVMSAQSRQHEIIAAKIDRLNDKFDEMRDAEK